MSTTTSTTAEEGTTTPVRLVGGGNAANVVETGEASSASNPDTPSAQKAANNPPWWPTDHRRIPDYRQVQYHPEWHELSGGSFVVDMFILVLFKGCGLLSVSNTKAFSEL